MKNEIAAMLTHGRTPEQIKEDALFRHGYLTGDGEAGTDGWAVAAIALADVFGQRVTGDVTRLDDSSVRCAERNLGLHVPEPFYRGFPESVLGLSVEERIIDQLLHYFSTYGTGDFSGEAGHSVFENADYNGLFKRHALDEEHLRPAKAVVSRKEANELVASWVTDILGSRRPAAAEELALAFAVLSSDPDFQVERVACRETLVYLADVTDDERIYESFRLRDILGYAEWTTWRNDLARYGERMLGFASCQGLKNLHMRNQDRKRVTALLDRVLERGLTVDEKFECFERQADWVGLLHHIHYKAKCDNASAFVNAMRSSDNKSRMSNFESMLACGHVAMAADYLARTKGQGALLRNLDYLLSRTTTEFEMLAVLHTLKCQDVTQLIQLMLHYAAPDGGSPRAFTWTKFGTRHVHHETEEEAARRRSRLSDDARQHLLDYARELLRSACEGRIEYAYIDEGLRGIAVPLNESTSSLGVNTLPSGSRIKLEDGTIRAFTYWEKTNDVDLSMFGLAEDGSVHEFSWRTMACRQSEAITFSGDITNGYRGGSEYFDLNLDEIRRLYPNTRYIVCCDNVYSGTPFDKCDVRAGYMLRKDATAGKVFEPKTVRTSFAVTGNSTYAYLFAIDIETRELIWLNTTKNSNAAVAGRGGARNFDFLERWFHVTETIDLYQLIEMMTVTQVDNVCEAQVAFVADRELVDEDEDVEVITPADTERIRALLH